MKNNGYETIEITKADLIETLRIARATRRSITTHLREWGMPTSEVNRYQGLIGQQDRIIETMVAALRKIDGPESNWMV